MQWVGASAGGPIVDVAAGATVTITDVSPAQGPVLGGTMVTVTGKNFGPRNAFCRFGVIGKVPAIRISDHEVRCSSPPSRGRVGTCALEVSTNNADFSATGVQFQVAHGL